MRGKHQRRISRLKADRLDKFLGNCPICNKKFTSAGVFPIGEEGGSPIGQARLSDGQAGMETLYAECPKCDTSVVLGVMKNAPGIVTTIGMLTDMRREDIARMKDFPPLTLDDVLAVHTYLETY